MRLAHAILAVVCGLGLFCSWFARTGQAAEGISVFPTTVLLRNLDARQRLLVSGLDGKRNRDYTADSKFQSDQESVATVSADGVVVPKANGQANITIQVQGKKIQVPVQVTNCDQPALMTFERDIEPVLARHGCNAGSCHGKARGQNGFALSLLGYDVDFDYAAITQEGRGRRIFAAAPEASLFLMKAAGQTPHGGGARLRADHPDFKKIQRWITAGCPRTSPETAKITKISVFPTDRVFSPTESQQLVVTAHYSDGTTEDVTHLTAFQSNDSVYAAVDAHGFVRAGSLPGEATIMARFQHQFTVFQAMIPLPGTVPDSLYTQLPKNNFIDGLVWSKLQRLGITPSDPASDSTFHRRAYLDVIGKLPTPQETRKFLASPDPKKREKLLDQLLARPEYVDFWANKWADLLRPNPYRVGIKAVFNLDAWLRESFRANKPYDQFVRELLTAQGSTFKNGAVVLFRDRREPDEITTIVSQVFLGVRLECAKCHHHPFEIYGQNDFYSFAAFFSRIGHKGTGLSPPISGGEEFFFTANRGQVKHPVNGRIMPMKALLGREYEVSEDQDPREVFAAWLTAPDNRYFAKVMVNRVWADMMGRGLVEPVDDLRATNPAVNEPLLDALAEDFRKNGYDIKKLIKTIASSYVYGLSSIPKDRNTTDGRNYSRHYRQRVRAEVLLDAVSEVTDVRENFAAMPLGSRAVELWTVRGDSIFLDSFGRPDPNQDPPCERTSDTTVVQALHLMNAPQLQAKVTADTGRVAKLAASKLSDLEIIDELYLLTYCRFPSEDERAACKRWFNRPNSTRRQAVEDLMWALLNTPEFVLKD